MGRDMRRVTLLGAFEIEGEADPEPAMRDGLILGSRREQRGFVLETTRDNVEQILALGDAPRTDLPTRLAAGLGPTLRELGYELKRVELVPFAHPAGAGGYVQGTLFFKGEGRKFHKLPMTATEAIHLAIYEDLPMWAARELLQLNVSPILDELDAYSSQVEQEAKRFRTFVNSVTATDFARFYEGHADGPDDAAG